MLNSIKSFTELALLNKYALGALCPSNCELKMIDQEGDSILDTIDKARIDVFDNPLKTSLLHKALKPIRFVARGVYTIAVCALISPLGVAFNGARTSFYLSKWAFAKITSDHGTQFEAMAKTKKVAAYLFLDLCCAVYGLLITGMGYLAITDIWYSAFGAGIITWMTEPYAPDSFFAKLLASEEEATGMYIAMALRNQLGLCGKDGNLLRYGKDDAILSKQIFNQYRFEGPGLVKIGTLLFNAEMQLLDDVKKANAFLSQKGTPITFSYPFNGSHVAEKIKDSPTHKHLHDKLELQQKKIDLLKEIWLQALSISSDSSPLTSTIGLLFGHSPIRIEVEKPKSFVHENYYKNWFDLPFSHPSSNKSEDLFKSMELEGWDPETTNKDDANAYTRFNRKIRENIWKANNGQEIDSFHSIIDLEDNYSVAERNKKYRQISLAVHPDKNPNRSDEAEMLFKALNNINQNL